MCELQEIELYPLRAAHLILPKGSPLKEPFRVTLRLMMDTGVIQYYRRKKFSVARKTNQLKIPYYVKDNFHSEYQGSVGRLEASVEEEYLNNLKHSCYRERNYKETMLMKARNFGDRDLYFKAQNINTPSCDKLHSLHN
ncbi:hypothetical protein quinque_000823 [Culex quinquefasciatus]